MVLWLALTNKCGQVKLCPFQAEALRNLGSPPLAFLGSEQPCRKRAYAAGETTWRERAFPASRLSPASTCPALWIYPHRRPPARRTEEPPNWAQPGLQNHKNAINCIKYHGCYLKLLGFEAVASYLVMNNWQSFHFIACILKFKIRPYFRVIVSWSEWAPDQVALVLILISHISCDSGQITLPHLYNGLDENVIDLRGN